MLTYKYISPVSGPPGYFVAIGIGINGMSGFNLGASGRDELESQQQCFCSSLRFGDRTMTSCIAGNFGFRRQQANEYSNAI